MIEKLSKSERQSALVMLMLLAIFGLAVVAIGRNDLLGVHGAIIFGAAAAGLFLVISRYYAAEPNVARLSDYYDDPSKVSILIAMGWAVIGLFVGDWVAWLLVNPDLTFDAPWASFGRLRPVHTTADRLLGELDMNFLYLVPIGLTLGAIALGAFMWVLANVGAQNERCARRR